MQEGENSGCTKSCQGREGLGLLRASEILGARNVSMAGFITSSEWAVLVKCEAPDLVHQPLSQAGAERRKGACLLCGVLLLACGYAGLPVSQAGYPRQLLYYM